MRLNPYIASQLVYKHGHCAHFAVSEKPLRPLGAKLGFLHYFTTRIRKKRFFAIFLKTKGFSLYVA